MSKIYRIRIKEQGNEYVRSEFGGLITNAKFLGFKRAVKALLQWRALRPDLTFIIESV